ncbi:MAG TPA: hypothetical protein DHV88_00575 [Roseburia sp.]|nr:hypothetical protein [Roseburia sp.]
MRMNKRILVFGMTTAFAASLLGGCGTSTSNTSSVKSSVTSNAVAFNNTTLTGTVTKVDGSTITLSLASSMGGMMGGVPQGGGQMPSGNGNAPGNTPADNNTSSDNSTDSKDQQTPPDKPDGDSQDSNNQQTPPDKPDGHNTTDTQNTDTSDSNTTAESNDSQTPPDLPSGEALSGTDSDNSTTFTLTISDESVLEDITLDDITEGTTLTITFGDDNSITSIAKSESNSNAPGGMGGGSTTVDTGTGATTITSDTEDSNATYASSSQDENALRVEGSVSYTGDNLTIKKSGDTSNTENSDFYGLNAGFLTLDGANTTLSNSTITTDAQGANGIFVYGEGSSVDVSNTTITTSADNSGGIDVTGGASIKANNLNIETSGNSSAAIRSDRGGGTLDVSNGTYTTNGTGSPAVYCTADISVSNATLQANASEGVVIEGQNSVTLTDCDVTGNMQGTYQGDENENLHTIMIYQSMSGDAEEGEANLSITGGSITGENGDLIYSTNTSSVVNLEDVDLTLANDTLLRIEGNDGSRGWGTSGSNGADMSLFATKQTLTGKIIVDEISSLTLTMSDNSSFEGSINENQEGGTVAVSLDDSSTWTLTGDSYVTSFEGSMDNVNLNGYTLYVDGVAQSK